MDDEDDSVGGIYEINRAADNVQTKQEFLDFLDMLREEIVKDREAEKRFQLEFLSVVVGELKFCQKFSCIENETIDFPDNPDWNWLARLFLVGAFEN